MNKETYSIHRRRFTTDKGNLLHCWNNLCRGREERQTFRLKMSTQTQWFLDARTVAIDGQYPTRYTGKQVVGQIQFPNTPAIDTALPSLRAWWRARPVQGPNAIAKGYWPVCHLSNKIGCFAERYCQLVCRNGVNC